MQFVFVLVYTAKSSVNILYTIMLFFFVELHERCVFLPLADVCVLLAFSFPVLFVLRSRDQKKRRISEAWRAFSRANRESLVKALLHYVSKSLIARFGHLALVLQQPFKNHFFFKVLILKQDITNKRTTSTKVKNVHLCLPPLQQYISPPHTSLLPLFHSPPSSLAIVI